MELIENIVISGFSGKFQSPISGVNDWNWTKLAVVISVVLCFSLLLAELMIGTIEKRGHYAHVN